MAKTTKAPAKKTAKPLKAIAKTVPRPVKAITNKTAPNKAPASKTSARKTAPNKAPASKTSARKTAPTLSVKPGKAPAKQAPAKKPAVSQIETKTTKKAPAKAVSLAARRKASIGEHSGNLRDALRRTPILDGKPILPTYTPPSRAQRAAQDAATIREVVAKAAIAVERETATPLAQPRPGAQVQFDLADIVRLENSVNGLSLLRLETPNSQGAICIYDNGIRVAAGVLSTAEMATMRVQPCTDLVGHLNTLMHPVSAAIEVTETAKAHISRLLEFCAENAAPESVIATAVPPKTKRRPRDVPARVPVEAPSAVKPVAPKPAKKVQVKTSGIRATNITAIKTVAKAPAKKVASKKSPVKPVVVKKAPAKKVASKKVAVKKSPAKKVASKKVAAKKSRR